MHPNDNNHRHKHTSCTFHTTSSTGVVVRVGSIPRNLVVHGSGGTIRKHHDRIPFVCAWGRLRGSCRWGGTGCRRGRRGGRRTRGRPRGRPRGRRTAHWGWTAHWHWGRSAASKLSSKCLGLMLTCRWLTRRRLASVGGTKGPCSIAFTTKPIRTRFAGPTS